MVRVMVKTYPYGKGDRTVQWVSAEWLESHLHDKDLVVVDCQPNVHEYIQDHNPGAMYAHENLFRIHVGAIPTRSIPVDIAEFLFRSIGLERKDRSRYIRAAAPSQHAVILSVTVWNRPWLPIRLPAIVTGTC